MLYKNKKIFEISPIFLLLLSIVVITGYKKEFFVLFLIVFFHEIAHVFVAYLLGVKIEKIFITPLGQRVTLKEFDYISTKKKFLIILAGPLLNFIFYFLFEIFLKDKYFFVKEINMAILIFNLLPVYPLDGGRFLEVYLGNKIGIINSGKLMNKISHFFCYFIIILGIIQVILYPINISLLCLSIYLKKINKEESININYNIYKILAIKDKKLNTKEILNIRYFLLNKETYIKKILDKITWDKYYIIYFLDENKNLHSIKETEIIDYYLNKGPQTRILDINKNI